MITNLSGLIRTFLLMLMLVGFWLTNSDTTFVIGLLLCFCALAGMVVVVRQSNTRALKQDERAAWEIVRAKGRRHFILRAVMYGFIVGLMFLCVHLILSRWAGARLGTIGFAMIGGVIILFTGGSGYAAIRTWSLNEERYKESRDSF